MTRTTTATRAKTSPTPRAARNRTARATATQTPAEQPTRRDYEEAEAAAAERVAYGRPESHVAASLDGAKDAPGDDTAGLVHAGVIETSADAPSPEAPAPRASRARTTTTPATRLGRELASYLRRHTKMPYGRRGEEAIRQLAMEAAHAARVELAASDDPQ